MSSDRRDEVEDAVREDRAEQRRPAPSRARHPAASSTATRASSPMRAGQHGVREQADAERGEDERGTAACGGGSACVDHRLPGERARDDREQVEPDRGDDPLPLDGRERVGDDAPRPARATRAARRRRERRERRAHRRATAGGDLTRATAGTRHAGDLLVDRGEPRARCRPTRSAPRASSRAAAPSARGAARPRAARRAPRASASASPGGTSSAVSSRHHVAVAGDVGRDDRRRARERAREHHAEALAAERRRGEHLRARAARA